MKCLALPVMLPLGRLTVLASCLVFANACTAAKVDLAELCTQSYQIEYPAELKNVDIVLLGEMHGTNEFPAYLGDLTCAMLQDGKRVQIGFELPKSVLDEFSLTQDKSPMTEKAVFDLISNPQPDGRNSWAVRQEFGNLLKLKNSGLPIDIFFYDPTESSRHPDEPPVNAAERIKGMSDNIISSARRTQGDVTLVLIGNYHMRRRLSEDKKPVSVFSFIEDANDLSAISLHGLYQSGKAWICRQECGPANLGDYYLNFLTLIKAEELADVSMGEVKLFPVSTRKNFPFDGVFFIGPITLSEPED